MNGGQIFDKLVLMHKYVIDNCGTGLGDYMSHIVLLQPAYVRPCTDVGTERNVVDFMYTQPSEPHQHPLPVVEIGTYCGGGDDGYFCTRLQILEKSFGIIFKRSCSVVA